MDFAITIDHLVKSYETTPVLKGISLDIKKGEIFALLGMNGAGKTTTLECIEGLRKFEQGKIMVYGKCGVQLQNSALPKNIKAIEALQYFANWQSTTINTSLLQQLGITAFLHQQYDQLSTGQKRKLHLAISLLGNPDILILDEPTAGLDVDGRIQIHQEIKDLKKLNKTIVLATHDMAEVQELCDRVAILKDGEIAFLDTCNKLSSHTESHFTLSIQFSKIPLLSNISYKQNNFTFDFETQNIETTLQSILTQIQPQNISIINIQQAQTNLNQRFLEIAKGV